MIKQMIQHMRSHRPVSQAGVPTSNNPDELNQTHRAITQKQAQQIDGDFKPIRDGLAKVDRTLESISGETNPITEELNQIKNCQGKRGAKGGLRGKKVAATVSGVALVGGTVGGKITLGVLAKTLGFAAAKTLGATAVKALGITAIATAGPIVGGVALGVAGAVVGWNLVRGNEAKVDQVRDKLDSKDQKLSEVGKDLGSLQQRAETTIQKAQANQETRGEALELWTEQIVELEGQVAGKLANKDKLVEERGQELYDAEHQRLQEREAKLEQRELLLDAEQTRVDKQHFYASMKQESQTESTQNGAPMDWNLAHA